MRERTEDPLFQRSPYRWPDVDVLRELKRWLDEHPTGIRARAVAKVIEMEERAADA